MGLHFREEAFRFLFFLIWILVARRVWEDNAGAIHLAKNPPRTDNSKHIDARHHFLREHVDSGELEVTHVASVDQHADFSYETVAPGSV